MKKIVLIGPVYPYRGGIAHYTGLMYRELSKQFDVEMISYKMQYPKLLFKKEQRDYENDSFKIEQAKYLIHTANPFNLIKTAGTIKKMKPDMVLFQWWHPYFAPCYKLLQYFMGRQNITFVCHNVFPHERFPMDRFLTKWALRSADHYILHAEEERKELCTIKKDADCVVTPHPTYNAFRFRGIGKKQARQELGLSEDEKVLLFFGFVRAYKGLNYLLEALPEITKELQGSVSCGQTAPDAGASGHVTLMVVGEFGDDKETYLKQIKELGIDENVRIADGYMPDRSVEPYFAAADAVILPYVSATQSGIVQIAYGFEKPVIVTDVGGLPDVVCDNVTGFVVEPENAGALAKAVIRYYREQKETEFAEHIRARADRFAWERMGEVVSGFFK